MDNLNITDANCDKIISNLHRQLDARYDRIDEVVMTEWKFLFP